MICRKCEVDKDPSEFKPRHKTCKACHLKRQKEWIAARPEKRHEYNLRASSKQPGKHGIDLEAKKYLWEKQKGRCGICNRKMRFMGRGGDVCHIDHDHKSGNVRGLLCQFCNQGLGMFFDKPHIIRAAFRYIADSIQDPTRRGFIKIYSPPAEVVEAWTTEPLIDDGFEERFRAIAAEVDRRYAASDLTGASDAGGGHSDDNHPKG